MLDWLLCALVRTLAVVLSRLSPEASVKLGETLGGLAEWFQAKRVRVGLRNLRAAYGASLPPAEARRIVHQIFQHMGASVVEMLRLPVIDEAYIDRYIEIAGREHFEAAKATGRPLILLTGHYGNWELSSITSALKGYPMIALARAQDKLPKLYALLVSYRESKGCRIVHKGGAMRQLMAAIDRRELVGIVGDQANRRGILIDFYGRPAFFATGPFQLAVSRHALVLPGFVRRMHGPHHRLTIEPPIDVTAMQGSEDEVIRRGLEQFAATLRRHIDMDPGQWLWMHKRWKHTPARRVVVLSDGKRGHVKQSQTVVRALREEAPFVTDQTVEVRFRGSLARGTALVWARLAPWLTPMTALRLTLRRESCAQLETAEPDLVVSCGSSTTPVNRLFSAARKSKSVVVMNPAPLPLSAFDLALVPAHDRVAPAPNVVRTHGALGIVDGEAMARGREALRPAGRFPAGAESAKIVALLLGGDTPEYRIDAAFVDSLVDQALRACEAADAGLLVTTSRRTGVAIERRLEQRLAAHPRCWLLVLAGRDPLQGAVEGMLGWAQVAVVTGESVSMVSEACASGRSVIVVEPPLRDGAKPTTKAHRFLLSLAGEGYVQHRSLDELSAALSQALAQPGSGLQLETFATVRAAVKRLL